MGQRGAPAHNCLAEPERAGRVTRRAGASAEDGRAVDAPGGRRLVRSRRLRGRGKPLDAGQACRVRRVLALAHALPASSRSSWSAALSAWAVVLDWLFG